MYFSKAVEAEENKSGRTVSDWEFLAPVMGDFVAEDVLIGLMLTGRKDVLEYVDIEPGYFRDPYYKILCRCVLGAWQDLNYSHSIAPENIQYILDRWEIWEQGKHALPKSWYLSLMDTAVRRTNKVIDAGMMTLPEVVTSLCLRIKVADGDWHDYSSGNCFCQELFLAGGKPIEELYQEMLALRGYTAAFLREFKEEHRAQVFVEMKAFCDRKL